MKKVLASLIMFGFADAVLAASHRIDLCKNSDSGEVEVQCGDVKKKLKENNEIRLGNFAMGVWNGENFSLTSSGEISENLNISSRDVPVAFDSFFCLGKCKVRAPGVQILEENQLTDFSVDLANEEENTLDVDGYLKTKFCNVSGFAIINGEMEVSDGGTLSLKSLKENALMVDGTLSSPGTFTVDMSKSFVGKIVNNGQIIAPTEVVFDAPEFSNEEEGQVRGNNVQFRLRGALQNFGMVGANQLSVDSATRKSSFSRAKSTHINFIQGGTLRVNQANLNCNITSLDDTGIDQLTFSEGAEVTFDIDGGEAQVGTLTGKISTLKAGNNSAVEIGEMRGGAKLVKSWGGQVKIGNFISEGDAIFSADSGGEISVDRATARKGFMYSKADGVLNFSNFDGEAFVSAGGAADVHFDAVKQVRIVSEGEAKTMIEGSNVKDAYLLDQSTNVMAGTKSKAIYNKGKLTQLDTETETLDNEGEVTFHGTSSIGTLNNYKTATFEAGTHNVRRYNGKSGDALLKVQGNDEDGVGIGSAASINLKDGNAHVTIDQAHGLGTVQASQQRYNSFTIPFFLKGNVDVMTKRMPKPNEIAEHGDGYFKVTVDMDEDFINSKDLDYGDVLFMLNMQGHKWENRGASFEAGALDVDNASVFGNYDGSIKLEKQLNVHAWQIVNSATAIARENGRLVDDWSNWRARLIYYCPATYYSTNFNTGIAVEHGDIILRSGGDIINQFSTIRAAGTFNASAGQTFDNVVSYITASGNGDSSISAKKIRNRCLDAYLRRGEAHASGRCGWGPGRHTWHADSYTAEWITQSPGSRISVGGNLTMQGEADNFGSSILSNGLFYGHVNSRSLFENGAVHGSRGAVIEGDQIKCSCPFLFVHRDVIETAE